MNKILVIVFVFFGTYFFGQKRGTYTDLVNGQIHLLDSMCDMTGRNTVAFNAKGAELNYFSSTNPSVLHTIKISYKKGNRYKTEIYSYDSQKLKVASLNEKEF